jgi:pimeloyl-ACP methyl ester carboxylesterase
MPSATVETYANLHGTQIWYAEYGQGDPLVMFHPGGVDASAFQPNIEGLAQHFRIFLPERRGHGHTPDADGPYSYELMAEDMIQFIEQVVGRAVHLFGMSDGGIVALLVAQQRPDLVLRLVCVASVFHRSGWLPSAIAPVTEPPEFMVASYKALSPDPLEHLPIVLEKLNVMHEQGPRLTSDDLKQITCRTLVMVGDDDEVTLEHAVEFYRSLSNSELAVIPGTSHGLLVEKPTLCNTITVDFLSKEPVTTFAPIRRA